MRHGLVAGFAIIVASCGLAGAISQLGCATILGFDNFTGTSEEGTFLLQSTTGCLAPDGTYAKVLAPLPTKHEYEVLVRTADGGFVGPFRPDAATSADPILRFRGLPAGKRYVRRLTPSDPAQVTYYILQGNRLEIGGDVIRRADAALAPAGTTLQVRPTGLSDAGATDDQVQGSLLLSLENPSGIPPTWNAPLSDSAVLFDGTRGDVAWVMRKSQGNWSSAAQICKFPDGYRMNDAGASSVSVACATPTSKQHLDVDMTLQTFATAAQRDAKEYRSTTLTIHTTPGGGDFGPSPSHDLASGVLSPGTGEPIGVDFANPAPGTWSAIAEVRSTFYYQVVKNAAGETTGGTTTVGTSALVSGTSVSLAPRVSAPGVTVGGKDVVHGGFVTGIGSAPSIVLTPVPRTPTPTRYELSIYPPSDFSGQWSHIHVYSQDPEIVLPPNSLVAGTAYSLEVYAYALAHGVEGEPERGLFDGFVHLFTNYFSP